VARYLPILCLALIHALVDAVAMFIEPLWPELRDTLALSERELFVLLSIVAIAPNFSQVLFGLIQDRFGSRYLLWLGPAVAAICLSAIGRAGSALSLGLLLAVGYLFIGSFHPEGTVFAGQLLPERRTRAISLFIFGGTLGLSLGPVVSGNLVQRFGLGALQWLAVPALVLIVIITLLSRRAVIAAEIPHTHAVHARSRPMAARWKLALFLLLVCSLRVIPNTGMTRAIAFALEERGFVSGAIGTVQSLFLVCGSLGILIVGSRFGHGYERQLMIYSPVAAIPLMLGLALPGCPTWLLVALLVPSGLIVIGTTPAMVSYAHQLFPNDAGMASALTMGLSWGTSGLAVAGVLPVFVEQLHQPALLFAMFAPCLAASAAGAVLLPRVEEPYFAATSNLGARS
jgi:FSR family fosmidomycin resistance protein-like MFS transporter